MSLYLGDTLIAGSTLELGKPLNIGQIIQSALPLTDAGLHLLDGAKILGGGIYDTFVNYIADLYDTLPKTSNITKFGSLTDTDGVLSGFSSSNYAKFPTNFQPSTNAWEIKIKVTTGAINSSWQHILVFQKALTNADRYATRLSITTNNKFGITLSYNGTAWDVAGESTGQGTHTVLANTTYYLKFQYTGSAYILSYSLDGENYTQDCYVTSSTPIYNSNTASLIGTWNNGSFVEQFLGSIDLNESYININGSRWWTGVLHNCFTDENTWQQSVANYGVCGKFVYDSINNTVRLPKYSNKIYTSSISSNVPVIGNGIALGLTDGTHNIHMAQFANIGMSVCTSGSDIVGSAGNIASTSDINLGQILGVATNGAKSGIIADLSNITTSLDGYYYIVIATTTKTEIQVDIDEIATDLNGKADVDLSNCTKPYIVETYINGTSWYNVYSNGWCEQGGHTTSSQGAKTVSLLKQYVNTNYSIVSNPYENRSDYNYIGCINGKTTASFGFYDRTGSGSDWHACGYIS